MYKNNDACTHSAFFAAYVYTKYKFVIPCSASCLSSSIIHHGGSLTVLHFTNTQLVI